MSVYYTLCFPWQRWRFIAFANQYVVKIQGHHRHHCGLHADPRAAWCCLANWVGSIWEPRHQDHGASASRTSCWRILGFVARSPAGLHQPQGVAAAQKWEITILAIARHPCSPTFLIGYGFLFHRQAAGLGCTTGLLHVVRCPDPPRPHRRTGHRQKMKAPPQIAIQIGESLFNDGVGLVIFATVFAVAFGGVGPPSAAWPVCSCMRALRRHPVRCRAGSLAHVMISATDDGSLELLLTLCIPTAGFAFANMIGVSGALAMVVTGIAIGNWTRHSGFSEQSQHHLDHFWELMDQFLNALLFLLIGWHWCCWTSTGATGSCWSSRCRSAWLPASSASPALCDVPQVPQLQHLLGAHPHLGRPAWRSGHSHGPAIRCR